MDLFERVTQLCEAVEVLIAEIRGASLCTDQRSTNTSVVPRAPIEGRGRPAKLLLVDGQYRTAEDWANIRGIPAETIRRRLKKGWTHEKAINTPLAKCGRPRKVSPAAGSAVVHTGDSVVDWRDSSDNVDVDVTTCILGMSNSELSA